MTKTKPLTLFNYVLLSVTVVFWLKLCCLPW